MKEKKVKKFLLESLYKKFESLVEPFSPIDEIVVPPKNLFGFIFHYMKPFRYLIILLAFLSASIGVIEAQLYRFFGTVVDVLKDNEFDQLWTNASSIFLFGFALLFCLPFFQLVWSLILRQSLNARWLNNLRWQAHNYLLSQSMGFYSDDFSGRISSKMLQTMVALREFSVKIVDVFTYLTVFIISLLFIIGSLHVMMLIPFLLWAICYVAILRYYLPKLNKTSYEVADANSFMTGRIVDSYNNIQTVKLFSHSRRERAYAKEGLEHLLSTATPQLRYITGLTISVNILNVLLFAGLITVSVFSYGNGIISLGVVALALAFAQRLSGLSMWIMWELTLLFQHLGTIYDGMEMLTKPIAIQESPSAQPLRIKQGNIKFEDMSFQYDGNELFNDFNLNITAGEKVGIVGRSGAGKSTLVNLLLRFYELKSGTISLDGQKNNEVTQDSLRQAIGVVTQDTALLNRSIKDNILYGNPDASDEQLEIAIRQSKVSDFIDDLVDNKGNTGINALVGERGVKLSGGQRQRIAIARVLLKNAPILVLDEATSALDSEVELAITQSFDELMHNKTVIAIAHRLSTLAAMDRLIIMDEGKIVEEGTHAQLLANGYLYAKLWEHQSGGFLDV